MNYTASELLSFFFIYAFLGWGIEIIYAAVHQKKFANRGFLNAPLCPIYGGSMVFLLVFFDSLKDNFFFLFMGCIVVTTLSEWFTGVLMEKLLGRKWWDYSDYKYNVGGYVCLNFSLIWGVAAVTAVKLIHPGIIWLVDHVPKVVLNILLLVLTILLICDFIVSLGVVLKIKMSGKGMQKVAAAMEGFAGKVGQAITTLIQKRILKAFPHLEKSQPLQAITEVEHEGSKKVFARGCGFHKLVWLFMIGSFLGDVTETIFCRLTMGYWMSRSSVVYGRFSIVWGLGIVLLTLLLHRYKDRSDRYIFVFGTVIGGAYEYACSVFTELAFGTVFWDYSGIPFNLGGRINLLYCFFWGIAALVWLKLCYPFLTRLIEKIPIKLGTVLSWIFVVFMTVNLIISAAALDRYSARAAGQEPENILEQLLDERFGDERMERIYPKAKMTGN